MAAEPILPHTPAVLRRLREIVTVSAPVDRGRRERFEAWASGLKAAIDTIRRVEGFDGRERVWRTLGDVVGMQRAAPAPEPVERHTWRTRSIIACPDCGAGRFEGQACRHCEPQSARF